MFAWAVEGARRWYAEGLGHHRLVAARTSAMLRDNDPVSQFIAECAMMDDSAQISVADLNAAMDAWAQKSGMSLPSSRVRVELLKQKGLSQVHKATQRMWKGLRLSD